MEMFFIFIVMLAIVGIIAGFVYHPIITILIIVAIIFLLSKTLFKSDKEKYTETVPINPERSEFIISKIERTLTCFACYVPYIDIYLKQIDPHKYKIVIRVDFINDQFDFNADWVSEHVFPTWKDDLYENSLGKKVQRLIWEFPFCSSSITSTSDVAAFAKYIQKELEQKYPQKFFANLYTSYSDGVFGIMENGLFPEDLPTTQKPSASTTTSRVITSQSATTTPSETTATNSTNMGSTDLFDEVMSAMKRRSDSPKK